MGSNCEAGWTSSNLSQKHPWESSCGEGVRVSLLEEPGAGAWTGQRPALVMDTMCAIAQNRAKTLRREKRTRVG